MNLSLDTQILYSPAMSKNGTRPDFKNQPGEKKKTIFIDCHAGCFGPPSELFFVLAPFFFVCVVTFFCWGQGAAQEDYLFQIARKEYTWVTILKVSLVIK